MAEPHTREIEYLSGLLETTKLVRSGAPLKELLEAIAHTIGAALGFGAVVVNLYRPAWDDLVVEAVHGTDEARRLLLGTARGMESWRPLLDSKFLERGAYFIRYGDVDWSEHDLTVFVPDMPTTDDGSAWHPEDALMVPMHDNGGQLLGVLSVDEPVSGKRPGDEELDILVGFADHAAFAIEQAQRIQAADEHQRSLQALMSISADVTRAEDPTSALSSVATGVCEALRFQRVMIGLLGDEGDYVIQAWEGWAPGDPAIESVYPARQLDRLFDPRFEIEGCYLMSRAEALELVDVSLNTYASEMNGRGPHAWNHHWLTVPLWAHDGSITGFLIADEPADRCLPTRDRLRALRLFADHAASAIEASRILDSVREARSLLQTMIDASPVAIVSLDAGSRVSVWNPAASAVFGWDASELVGRPLPFADHVSEALERAFRGESTQIEAVLQTRDGLEVACNISLAPIAGGTGSARGVICLIADVTARNQLSEKLRQRQKLESIGLLAGGIAHDFNNLLATILGNVTLALDHRGSAAELRECLDDIKTASTAAAELTKQLLAYAGKATIEMRSVDVSALLDESAALLRRAVPRDVRFVTSLEPDLPTVLADGAQLRQVAMNLITNAAEAIEGTGIVSLATHATDLGEEDLQRLPHAEGAVPGRFVCLEVSDTGSGIAAEDLPRIFDPFFSTKFVGRGLGLAAVLGIVRAHHGALQIESSRGAGATIRVYLPAETVPTRPPDPEPSVRRDTRGGTVLLVEDDEMIRTVARRILSDGGFDIREASSGESALAILAVEAGEIDVIVLDITMPGLPAIETYRQIRKVRADLPIVVCSGHSEQQVRDEYGFGDAPIAFLGKPYGKGELIDAISKVASTNA